MKYKIVSCVLKVPEKSQVDVSNSKMPVVIVDGTKVSIPITVTSQGSFLNVVSKIIKYNEGENK